MSNFPEDLEACEERLSRPNAELVAAMRRLPGDVMVLGVGGKMGPTLARMARRASDAAGAPRRVIGVSRFSNPETRTQLERHGVETIAADLLDEAAVESLPDAANVISMSGFKFGASAAAAYTWAINCLVPTHVCRRFRDSRIVAFSTGNVYGPVDVATGGSVESDPLRPVGEYAMAAVGRERMYEYFSQSQSTPTAILRLNYATELRYGVLVDLARHVFEQRAIDLSTAWVNVLWQTDANRMALRALEHTAAPARVLNVAGPELLRVREVAEQFGKQFGLEPRFAGEESPFALLNNATASYPLLGSPDSPSSEMIAWTAEWLRRGGETWNKPTMFQASDGQF